ncbi:MAG TPA: hypothetical protein VFH47_03900, partial [Candidatus Thermoplasmatota archaeon]|nr:hypothetical protein [Candidatus Thermoplasmatota archaeon]
MQRSGMYRAGEILLLVGAILSAFVALLMLLAAGGLSLAFGADGPAAELPPAGGDARKRMESE